MPGARVLFWSELFWPYIGGNETLAADLLPALAGKGHEFTVVTSHQARDLPDRDDYRGIPIHRFPFRSALASRSIETIASLRAHMTSFVGRLAPDVIHVSCVGPSSYFLPLASPIDRPAALVAHVHGEVLPSQATGHDSLLKSVLERADWVTSVSAAVHAQVTRVFPSIASRSSVIPNAVDDVRQPITSLPFTPPCVLCLGRLVADKGFDIALHVFARVAARIPHARFVMVGDGPERGRLEQQCRMLGLTDRVQFTGAVGRSDVPSTIDGATVVLMPSRREGLPLVAIETAQRGRPAVASRASGLGEVVVHGETGFLAPIGDVDALTEAVLTILQDHDLARRMGAAARLRARERFALADCAERFDDLYRRLMEGSGAVPDGASVARTGR